MRYNSKYILSAVLFFFMALHVLAIQKDELPADSTGSVADTAQIKSNFVYLINADVTKFNKSINPDAQILVGNVTFRHDSMYMYCDSALFYQKSNSFNAYDNVRMEQGDTLFLFGDSASYDGNLKIAKVRDNVRLENRNMVLLTDSLNYDRNLDLAYFINRGTLLDDKNTLTADYGQYQTVLKLATFINDVRLESPDYTMTSDTLYYDTDYRLAYFTSPTTIVSDENVINTRHGRFNTNNKSAILLDRSVLTQDKGLKKVVGDSLYYDDTSGIVEGFGKVELTNLKDKIDASGDYVYFNQENDSAVVTGNALAIEYSTKDSLYIHADTFRLVSFYNAAHDSVLYRNVRAYNKVKAYRIDLQMIADSLEFSTLDSCLTLYKDPIIWNDGQQLLGERIKIYMNDSTIDWVDVIDQTLFVQKMDSAHFNQISGREMKAYFANGEIHRTDVDGNVLVIYYPVDEDSTMIGMNTTEASFLSVFFVDKAVNRIVITKSSSGVLYPMDQLEQDKMYLSNFNWFEILRPFNRWDVFNWRGKQASEKLKTTIHREVPLPTLRKR
jgi:lipopolysaccharide export system protein LptA